MRALFFRPDRPTVSTGEGEITVASYDRDSRFSGNQFWGARHGIRLSWREARALGLIRENGLRTSQLTRVPKSYRHHLVQ
jgi:hypothetical protein